METADALITSAIQCTKYHNKQEPDKNSIFTKINNKEENVTQSLLEKGIAFLIEKSSILKKPSSSEIPHSVTRNKNETNHNVSRVQNSTLKTFS